MTLGFPFSSYLSLKLEGKGANFKAGYYMTFSVIYHGRKSYF